VPFPKTYVNPSFSAAYKGDSGKQATYRSGKPLRHPKSSAAPTFFAARATHRAALEPARETGYYVTYYLTIVTSENYKRPIGGHCTAVL
jgi:hypothetical protein